ncbi:hypothetical protein HFO06_26910 [Rhizobium leguminosarum]|uniref:hypothetical protein n=1 Tax=Rhizobium leguminosarum TaxID=384 RepID=UPI001C965369|nr:hypothetical protein [Rhizobium leguminosarum]MBY5766688.1 hypothetical protein [Rhizobium leguminosarum]
MSASLIFDTAPIGSIIAWSDGTPQPPERHRKKLSAWKTRHSQGRLVRKQKERTTGAHMARPDFPSTKATSAASGTIVLRIDSDLTFKIVECPAPPGSVRIFDRAGAGAELVHLAENRESAELRLKSHGYPNAVFEDVTVDGLARPAPRRGGAAA